MNSRRCIRPPTDTSRPGYTLAARERLVCEIGRLPDVRFGSIATFWPVRCMSALPPKADIRRLSIPNVCFVPQADIARAYSITSSSDQIQSCGCGRDDLFILKRPLTARPSMSTLAK